MTEKIITNEKTGGRKGSKPERYSLLPWPQLREVARVYAMGAEKYEPFNWTKGYDWSLGYDALIRHVEQFWSGEDRDSESELYHLAHAVFHCLALMYFIEHHPDLDDRHKVLDKDLDLEYDHIWLGAPCKILFTYESEGSPTGWKHNIQIPNGTEYTGVDASEVRFADRKRKISPS